MNLPANSMAVGERLQKVLAAAGLGSRRACEELIAAGRVSVDDVVVETQGMRVDPATAVIRLDGQRINVRPDLVYLALHKPVGVVSTMSDDRGRSCLQDFVQDRTERLFHVGRLDQASEGLLLLTNDGDLAFRLAHPSHGVTKVYLVEVAGPLSRGVGAQLRRGVELDDGPAAVDRFRVVQTVESRVLVEVTIHEGRKHIVRRMMAEVGHPVLRLVRTAMGPIRLGDLAPGQVRELSRDEVSALYTEVDQ